MSHADFVHLRVHTAYSLLEGAMRVPDVVKLARDKRMPAVAMTDTNNMFGAMEFSGACAGAGIQPIVGCQLAIGRDDGDKFRGAAGGNGPRGARSTTDSLVLLAKSDAGYRNLLNLLKIAYLDADAEADPQVALAALEAHGEGLIALTGGPAGPVGRLLAEGQAEAAEAVLARLKMAFPGALYVELMRHGLDAEAAVEPALIDLAYAHDLPLVATNEVFFSGPDMYEAHDALICIAGGTYVSETDRRRLTPDHGFKSAEEMRVLFADLPEAVDNTLVIARRCAFMVEKIDPILPPYDCGEGKNEKDVLRAKVKEGLEVRLEAQLLRPGMTEEERQAAAKPYRERMGYELGVIIEMGFTGYFLIVAEFIQWAKAHDIPVGPGRGSGAGSVVAWALTITDLDPLRFGLLFERFLNPERVSMPDFDIDFCQDQRDKVIRHVQEKYGRDKVAQIITFGKLQARAVLRDVGRVLQMPYSQVDRICKLVPNNPANPMTLDEARAAEPQLRQMIGEDPAVERLFNIARRLEGLYRHASTHAAGVVIGDRPLEQLVPLYRDPRSDMPVTGFNMKYVESAGLVKFDFLGLKTLTVLAKAVELVAKRGVSLNLSHLPLDDKATFDLLARGETTGVFQLESSGMRDILRKLKPDTFEDIIAIVALYRPGPMDNIPSYIRRKHGDEVPDYLYPTLEGILKETFGIIIYQEQVMQIAQELSGYTLGGADLLRRAMGKKIKAEMDKQRATFVDGAVARKVPQAKASEIFDLVAKFAGYGFNKSHAAAYALVAYQTAYLKANFPVEFMAASMTLDMHNTDKLAGYRQELNRLGIALLPPDINVSDAEFTVEPGTAGGQGAVRYALGAIKNVGVAAMQALVAERGKGGSFTSLTDLAGRFDAHAVNKRQMENLTRAGALECLNRNRRQVFEGIDRLLRQAAAAAHERASNQMGLFGGGAPVAMAEEKLPDTPDWTAMDRLREEFDAIGFYLSAHPLDSYGKSLERVGAQRVADILAAGRSGQVTLAGTVMAKRERTSAKGSRYAFVTCSDSSGVFEVTVFSEVLASARELLEVGNAILIKASAQFEGEGVRFTTHAISSLKEATAGTSPGMKVHLASASPLPRLKETLAGQGRGRGRVKLVCGLEAGGEVEVALPGGYKVSPSLIWSVQEIPGVLAAEEM
ncbi:MAG: DNA polymerase III subunit alpha [Rhodospirillales bacterium]|nr:DNA polymerase III subunit alpha [Rhodospirillales bacterium]